MSDSTAPKVIDLMAELRKSLKRERDNTNRGPGGSPLLRAPQRKERVMSTPDGYIVEGHIEDGLWAPVSMHGERGFAEDWIAAHPKWREAGARIRPFRYTDAPASGEPSGAPVDALYSAAYGAHSVLAARTGDAVEREVLDELTQALRPFVRDPGGRLRIEGEPSGAEAVVREAKVDRRALAKQAHDALALLVGDIANSDDWREEPRPHAQLTLDWLHLFARIEVPTAPGAPEEGAGE